MDNQQPSSEYEKVQRLSLRGVLKGKQAFIFWETPPIKNNIYLYYLTSSLSEEVRYVGITIDPMTRLSHHIKDQKLSHKKSWINHVYNIDREYIIMKVVRSFDNISDALKKEKTAINSFSNLTNHELYPTTPRYKAGYLYNLENQTVQKFASITQIMNITNRGILKNKVILGKYLFSYKNDFNKVIKVKASIKLKKDNIVKYAVSQQHAAWIIGCSTSMINLCLLKQRKFAKEWILAHINEEFPIYNRRNQKCIKCLNDGKVFNSIKEASEYYNVDESMISKVIRGIRKHVKKYVFVLNKDIVRS